MKAYRLTVLIVDFDDLGRMQVQRTIELQRYPNHCISPEVLDIEEAEIGEWTDDHPLNHGGDVGPYFDAEEQP